MLSRLLATFVLAVRHLLSQKGLTLAALLGLATAIALTMCIPMYADAVYYRVLVRELQDDAAEDERPAAQVAESTWRRPPFSFLFRYLGTLHGSLQWERVAPADQYFQVQAGRQIGLPVQHLVRHFRTRPFKLFPAGQVDYAGGGQPLGEASLGMVSNLADHVTIVEGRLPADPPPSDGGPLEALVSPRFAEEKGLEVGQLYTAFSRRYTGAGDQLVELPTRIVGAWLPNDPDDPFWFYHPSALGDVLLVPEAAFAGRVSPAMADEIALAIWYLATDGSAVNAEDVAPLFSRLVRVQQQLGALLPNTELDTATVEALEGYPRRAAALTVLLYAFAVPVVGLALAFVGMVMGLSVERRRNEIAILRSRGASVLQVVGMAAQEVLLVGGAALAAGTLGAAWLTRLMGHAQTFMRFVGEEELRRSVTRPALIAGLAALSLAMLALVLPTWGAARHTVVTFKQERARLLRPPWWQRLWVDLWLAAVAAYGAYLLRKQGAIALPVAGSGAQQVGDPFQNPLLFLAPVVGACAFTLLLLRVLPALTGGLAWLIARGGSVGMLLATRQLSRSPGFYATPLVLLVLTVSLAAFTASLAQTLDRHMSDRNFYRVGASLRLTEFGEENEEGAGAPPEGEEGPRWLFLPVSEHERVPGVRAAARVGRYPAVSRLSGGTQTGTFIGVDRVDFPGAAYWRSDFAPVRLGGLMNALASSPGAVLLPRSFMAEHGLQPGDALQVQVETFGQLNTLPVTVAGAFDLFPTWYEPDGPLFVGNLDHLFESVGGEFPYEVWLRTEAGAEAEQVVKGVRGLGLKVAEWDSPGLWIEREQERPERQGLFGLLSVGFISASVLTVAGFLVYALFSFRRRFIELGILRAVGLSSGQMASFLAWELGFLILTGVTVGTAMGVWGSRLFIPYLQVGTGPSARIPPFRVEIAWSGIFGVYGLFALLFLVALGILVALLARMQVFQAVKLGETT